MSTISDMVVKIKVKVDMKLWDAIKMRIAGIPNVKGKVSLETLIANGR
jgi:hypothetical protein